MSRSRTFLLALAVMALSTARAQAEGYTYQIGGTHEFFLIGGRYELYVDAHVTPAEAITGNPRPCYFVGDLTSLTTPQARTEPYRLAAGG